MRKCFNCNHELTEDDLFCPSCGVKLVSEAQEIYEDHNLNSLFIKYSSFIDNDSLYKVAIAKERGLIKKDFFNEDEELFKLLAFKGHLDSMFHYANILLAKVPQEKELAYKWLRIAAQNKHIPSINLLSTFEHYDDGSAKNNDYKKTIENTVDYKEVINNKELKDVAKKVLPSVVTITTVKKNGDECSISSGTGFIANGFIITNSHVLEGSPDFLEINFEPSITKNSYPVLPIVVNSDLDLALLACPSLMDELEKNSLEISSVLPSFGEEVFTIGNPLGVGLSISKGICSCPNREMGYPKKVSGVIQTDITINHGNSGGPLFNKNGQVIGIATFVPSESSGGMGMCIPASYISELFKNN